jgi:hypothetical protein
MATLSNVKPETAVLPELPSKEAQPQDAQRARSVPTAVPATSSDTPPGDTASRVRLVLLALPSLLTGASLLALQPPALAQAWARHLECARHYKRWYFRWPRYCWGAFHVSVTALVRVAEWVTSSPPLFVTAAAVAAGFWFFS